LFSPAIEYFTRLQHCHIHVVSYHNNLFTLATLHAFTLNVAEIKHFSNGYDDLLSNELTSPELTVAEGGRGLDMTLSSEASTDARLDVYMSNTLGHHLPGRIFSGLLPPNEREKQRASFNDFLLYAVRYFLLLSES